MPLYNASETLNHSCKARQTDRQRYLSIYITFHCCNVTILVHTYRAFIYLFLSAMVVFKPEKLRNLSMCLHIQHCGLITNFSRSVAQTVKTSRQKTSRFHCQQLMQVNIKKQNKIHQTIAEFFKIGFRTFHACNQNLLKSNLSVLLEL